MIISDLSFVEALDARVEGGTTLKIDKKINITERLDIKKKVEQKVELKGNLAVFEVDNIAEGKNTSGQVFITNAVKAGEYSMFSATGFAAATGY